MALDVGALSPYSGALRPATSGDADPVGQLGLARPRERRLA